MTAQRTKKRRSSYILTAFLLVVVCSFAFSWVRLQDDISQREQYIAAVVDERKVLEFENKEKLRILEDKDTTEYLKRKARIDNGFVLPGERVYHDVSTGSN
jgi:cell division protein FtsB